MRNKSHDLQWLETMYHRNGLTKEELKEYQRLKKGYEGELEFDKLFNLFFENTVPSVNDVTYKHWNTVVQIDKIVQIGNTLYVIDIKNYHGTYTYEKNEWRVGDKLLTHNVLEQLRRAVRVIQTILEDAGIRIQVKGVIVFMDPTSVINVIDAVEENILNYPEVVSWLHSLSIEDRTVNPVNWQTLLKTFEIEDYRTNHRCDEERLARLSKGMRCSKCGGYRMKDYRYTCACKCGHIEVKETTYVRTMCEYGLIMHHKELMLNDLSEFLSKKVNESYLIGMLRKHFSIAKSSKRYSSYKNKGLLMDEWFKEELEYFNRIEGRKQWGRKKVPK